MRIGKSSLKNYTVNKHHIPVFYTSIFKMCYWPNTLTSGLHTAPIQNTHKSRKTVTHMNEYVNIYLSIKLSLLCCLRNRTSPRSDSHSVARCVIGGREVRRRRAELGDTRRFIKQNQRHPEQQDKWAQK